MATKIGVMSAIKENINSPYKFPDTSSNASDENLVMYQDHTT